MRWASLAAAAVAVAGIFTRQKENIGISIQMYHVGRQ